MLERTPLACDPTGLGEEEQDRREELIGLERRCCPFLSFQLVVPKTHASVRLEIAGRNGVKEFIIAELRLPGAAVE